MAWTRMLWRAGLFFECGEKRNAQVTVLQHYDAGDAVRLAVISDRSK